MTQRASRITPGVVLAVLLAVPALARSSDPADDRIPIHDLELLESLGYAPGTPDIYATPEAYERMRMSPAERAAASRLDAQVQEVRVDTGSSSVFGETTGTVSLLGTDFAPLDASTDYTLLGSGTQVTCNNGIPFFRGVFPSPPHGARATVRRVWYRDEHATENIRVWLERTCFPFLSSGPPEITILRMNESSGTPGWGRFGPGNLLQEDLDSKSCSYALRVRLGSSNLDCTAGEDLGIAKASLEWRRRISPAPAAASFDDVPTDHLFFRQIEALAGSGITSGCDADSFCPQATLTRGQMAAFLATALGLDWDEPFWEPAP